MKITKAKEKVQFTQLNAQAENVQRLWQAAGLMAPVHVKIATPPSAREAAESGQLTAPVQQAATPGTPGDSHASAVVVGLTDRDLQERFPAIMRSIRQNPELTSAIVSNLTGIGDHVCDVIKTVNPDLTAAVETPIAALAVCAAGTDFLQALQQHDNTRITMTGTIAAIDFANLLCTLGVVPGAAAVPLKTACLVLKSANSIYVIYEKMHNDERLPSSGSLPQAY
jgi:hypothetical protein